MEKWGGKDCPQIDDQEDQAIIEEYFKSTEDHDEHVGEWITFKDKTFEQQCCDNGWLQRKIH